MVHQVAAMLGTLSSCLLVRSPQLADRGDRAQEAWQLCLALLQVEVGAADAVVYQAGGCLAYDCMEPCGEVGRSLGHHRVHAPLIGRPSLC